MKALSREMMRGRSMTRQESNALNKFVVGVNTTKAFGILKKFDDNSNTTIGPSLTKGSGSATKQEFK
jgi:hypothetical protein